MLQSPLKRVVFIVFCLASVALLMVYFTHCIDCYKQWDHCGDCQSIIYLLVIPCSVYWFVFAISAFAKPVMEWVKTGKL